MEDPRGRTPDPTPGAQGPPLPGRARTLIGSEWFRSCAPSGLPPRVTATAAAPDCGWHRAAVTQPSCRHSCNLSAMGAAVSAALNLLRVPASRLPANPRPTWLAVAAAGLAAVALGTVVWRRARPRRRRRLQQVGTVAQLWIFPIKSCKGVAVSEAECTALGLRSGHLRDRFWLVIDETGNMVTARQEPRLVLMSLTCEGDTLTLSAVYMKDLSLPIKMPTTNSLFKCRVHGLEIEGRDCGEAAAQWVTGFLKTQPYRLVQFEPHMRSRKSHQIKNVFRPMDQIAYADASPLLVLSEASLADLNSRLEKKVKATNFRPNIVVSGCGVYAEDLWSELLIGDVELKRVMACTRCILTTVDPDTGVMSRKEPLDTLKRFCKRGQKSLEWSPALSAHIATEDLSPYDSFASHSCRLDAITLEE
ncbi:mitochondrial amidoxime-reducing component 1 isoform X4 [Saccopteryx bilineata]|uniref:mitochondrial amidoxime-reducing component 1 isoform X4 n=1 Tax=Saccopteryx bilineata TaxID=59482 RepID=UPI00338D6273